MDGSFGRQAAGCGESVQTVARKLLGRDIVSEVASGRSLGQQVCEQGVQLLLRSGNRCTPVQECPELCGAMTLAAVADVGIGLQHRFEAGIGIAVPIPELGEMSQMSIDVPFVPGGQDRFDVREVLVQRRTSDPGFLGDLRHRHGQQPVLGHQRPGGFQDRLAHVATVRLDRLAP
jgi:hypothetical protein